MFNEPYRISAIGRRNVDSNGLFNNGGVIEEFLFKFKVAERQVYHIKVNRYQMDIFMIKFYSKLHENHPFKYNYLLGRFKASRVLATCYEVIRVFFIPRFEFGCFGFIGAQSLYQNGSMELMQNTKRFKLYSYMVADFHGLETFDHYSDPNYSSYLIVKDSPRKEKQLNYALELFALNYPDAQ